jgi:hypothetical protein
MILDVMNGTKMMPSAAAREGEGYKSFYLILNSYIYI